MERSLRSPDWAAISRGLANSIARPMFVLDETGRVIVVNVGLERLLGWDPASEEADSMADPTELALLPEDAHLRDLRRAQLRARQLPHGEVILELSISPIRHVAAEVGAVVCVVENVLRETATPTLPGEWVKISLDPSAFGTVLEAHAGGEQLVGRRCHDLFVGQANRCADCPLQRTQVLGGSPTLDVILDREGGLFIERSARIDVATAVVSIERIEPKRLSRIVAGRVATLARDKLLSDREVQVLEYLVQGDELEVIAGRLEISIRTVKFHQTNLLAKLGLGSRLELLRSVIAPGRSIS